jgi:hypothetical protein
MAPKGGNAKKEGGRAKKAENEVSSVHHVKSPVAFQPGLNEGLLSSNREGRYVWLMNRRRKQLKLIKLKMPKKLRNGNLVVSHYTGIGTDE